jgi:hypothetical protein
MRFRYPLPLTWFQALSHGYEPDYQVINRFLHVLVVGFKSPGTESSHNNVSPVNHHRSRSHAPSAEVTTEDHEGRILLPSFHQDQSSELQLRDLRAYCAARSLTIVREYVDIGQSGAKDSRPELNQLVADARKRKCDGVKSYSFVQFVFI